MTHLDTLNDRARYLGARIAAKRIVGWETTYDERERDALLWVIDKVSPPRPDHTTQAILDDVDTLGGRPR